MTQLHELSRPFPPHLVKKPPPGKFGSYVNHATVTERLLSIVGPFSFEVVDVIRGFAPENVSKKQGQPDKVYPARDNAIVGCTARLSVTIDGHYIHIAEVGTEDNPAMHHDADNLKRAASDAFKRCCMRIGLGLHLWSGVDYFLEKQLEADMENTPLANQEAAEELLSEVFSDDDPGRPFSQDIAGDAARKAVNTLMTKTEML